MPAAPSTGNFRRVTPGIYRIFSIVMLVALAIAGLDALGTVFACIPAFFFAVVGGVKLAQDWWVALPMWLFLVVWCGWSQR